MDSLPGRGARLTLIGAAILLVAGGMAVYSRPFETVRSAMRSGLRLSGVSEQTTVGVDGLPVRYLESGSAGHGSVLVLIHGLGGSAEDWGLVIPALARQHRVLALDLPGFGITPAPRPRRE